MADAQLSYLKNKVSLYPKSDTYSSLVKVSLPYNAQCLQGTRLDKNLPSLLGLVMKGFITNMDLKCVVLHIFTI